jgi:hypothetical protein
VCITETWLSSSSPLSLYAVDGYTSYFSCRKVKAGGGVMVLVRDDLVSRQLLADITTNDAFNVCAVVLGAGANQTLIAGVYRAPWSVLSDIGELCDTLDDIILKSQRCIITGDFNLASCSPAAKEKLNNIIDVHSLCQIACLPTRGRAMLDLVYVSSQFAECYVTALPPMAGSDHDAQLIKVPSIRCQRGIKFCRSVDYERLGILISQIDWCVLFKRATDADSYACILTSALTRAVMACTTYKPLCKRQRLPRHIVQLIRKKRKFWKVARISKDYTAYKKARKDARAAIRSHHRNVEHRMTYSNSRHIFFSYVSGRLRSRTRGIQLITSNGTLVSDNMAADMLLREFVKNFSIATVVSACVEEHSRESSLFQPYCSEQLVAQALVGCPDSNSCPDGISYKILKMYSQFLVRPINIVFQQSMYSGTFPAVWKHAVIIPLYKGRGDRSVPSSYRPISLCSCLGKLLERVMHSQLTSYINSSKLLSQSQHGFMVGKSTITNLLSCDAAMADVLQLRHAFDIVSFDFKAAFDKAPHSFVVEALAEVGVRGLPLRWYANFLTGRTEQVKVGECYSSVHPVLSGVVQGSVCGPGLYVILIDSLLRRISLPHWCFADDLKFLADVTVHSSALVQKTIDIICQWADERSMPLSLEKSGVMHCGRCQPNHVYYVAGYTLPVISSFKDLGVIRSVDLSYSEQCTVVASKASKTSGVIRKLFNHSSQHLLWPAFASYVLPVLSYASHVWSPYLVRDIKGIERVQRRFTKSIRGLSKLPYAGRLRRLNVLSVQSRRTYSDMIFVFKAVRGLINCSLKDLGLQLSHSNTRGHGIRLVQRRAPSRVASNLFAFRVPSRWNKLPLSITSCATLRTFKLKLWTFLIAQQ